ncbi:hypothetical protein DW355_03010 [Hylemonella gracilis]|uniref:Uncharacterized protein n=1 Tax=Hylemonella gracilis TaxID=80880 RepID=A0A4V1A1V6_9BURK|nr:DUF6587 family protein [Hylemonella gracilis]QBK03879.1 hypothetical protein DW355_03010 [Hylemonella gracilis]
MQNIVVALIVMACFVYAVQTLMPNVPRRALARWLALWPHWPAFLARRLQRAAREPVAGCGCDSCDRPTKLGKAKEANGAAVSPQPIHIQRRRP